MSDRTDTFRELCAPVKFNMAAVTKNRTYGKIAGFWVIIQKPLIISEIWQGKNGQHSKI